MAYTKEEIKAFALKDQKYSIGQSRGNSLSCATQLACALIEKALLKQDNFEDFVYQIADKFHHFNQVSIEKDFAEWKSLNEERLNEELGITPDIEKNVLNQNDTNFFKTNNKTA